MTATTLLPPLPPPVVGDPFEVAVLVLVAAATTAAAAVSQDDGDLPTADDMFRVNDEMELDPLLPLLPLALAAVELVDADVAPLLAFETGAKVMTAAGAVAGDFASAGAAVLV